MRVAAATPTHLFTDTATVERKTLSVDAGGSPVETWASHIASLACAIQPVSTSKAVLYGADRATRVFTLYCAPGRDITTKDRIVVIEGRTGSNVTRRYRVLGVKDLVTGNAVMEIDMEAVDATP